MKYKELSIEELIQLVKDRDSDLKEITRVILKMLGSLNLDVADLNNNPNATPKEAKKAKKDLQKKVLGSLSDIVTSMMFSSSSIEERFSFLGEFEPMLIKHQVLIEEIQAENEANE